jgi:RimJ/RimL family protein N-acetyltransferase
MGEPAPRSIWAITAPGADIECRVAPGCGVVALVVEQGSGVLRRETYPDDSTAFERARVLRGEYDEAVCREECETWLPTPTCALRPWRISDIPAVAAHANNSKIGRNLRDGFPDPYTPEDARAFIEHARSLVPPTRFAIVVQGEAVGSIGFTLHPNVERVSAEMGYWLGEAFWGRGITTDAVRALTRYAIAAHGLTRVYAVPFEWNPASARVLEKAGFVCEGRMRRSVIKAGQILDSFLYAFTVSEPGNPDAVIEP